MSGLFSTDVRERIRAANDIVDLIGSYIPLKKAGANFQALCPFHKEKTPSFNVNPHLQIFKCFGCGKGGDVFTFVMEYESVEFPEALKRLADRAKIPLEYEKGGPDGQTRHLKDQLLQIHEQITQRWQSALANEASGQIAREYLAKRGVSQDAIKLFRLGYAPELWDDTVNWAKSKGHPLELVEKAGLVIQSDTGAGGSGRFYDRFRGRLMFPICDEQGRVIGFSGRILSGDEKTAKYVNSPETPIFTKSKVFFGLDKSKRALLDAGFAIVCEGQLDLIACFMAGVTNVVAPQGTAFTAEHARIIKRYVNEVVLCFDSDEAGQNATLRSLDHLLASGLAVRVATIPKPHDPDSLIKESGAAAFNGVIEAAEGFFDWHLARLCAKNDAATDKGRLLILRSMAEAVFKTGNVVLIDKYAQKTAFRLGVQPEAVRTEFKKFSRTQRGTATQDEEAIETESEKPIPPHEHWLLKILFLHEDLVAWAAAQINPEWLTHPLVRETVNRRFSAHNDSTWTTLAAFLDQFEGAAPKNLVTDVTVVQRPIPNPPQQLADVTQKLRNEWIDRQMASLMADANRPELADEQKINILRKQQELRNQKRLPIKAESR